VLAYTDDATDLLVTRAESLEPFPPVGATPRGLVVATARLLGRAARAGLRHRDLHRGNLALAGGEPVLVDVGGARFGGGGLLREMGRAAHGVLGLEAPPRQCLRALKAWLAEVEPGADRVRRRTLGQAGRRVAWRTAFRYRRGRDRRLVRGRHFVRFALPGGGGGLRRAEVPAAWEAEAGAWRAAPPPGATPLKVGGRVVLARVTDHPDPIVLKRFRPSGPGRPPRPRVAFARAVRLEHRGVQVPPPLLAAWDGRGAGVLVSRAVPGADLPEALAAARGAARRRLLADVGRTLRRMHDAGVHHRDLKAPNVRVRAEGAGIVLVDLEGARVHRGPVRWRRRARDLARLDASLDTVSSTDRLRALVAYERGGEPPPVARRRFLTWLLARADRKRRMLAARAVAR
jgi:tRNA A-37 threonylcarbamoyl transferase component Bud32